MEEYEKINKFYIIFKVLILDEKYFQNDLMLDLKNRFANLTDSDGLIGLTNIDFNLLLLQKGLPETAKIEACINFMNFTNFKLFKKHIDTIVKISDIKDVFQIIPPWIDVNFYDGSKQFKSLSSGEKIFFSFIVNLLYQVNYIHKTYNAVNIFLDETELGLHPSWQKKYLDNMVNAINSITDKKVNLIFLTHSPFILSDIPNENVIFLGKDKNGNCKVINGLKDKKQTFGANIHTLLSDAFFMEDGLIGEFAKEKIQSVINFLNNKKSKIQSKEEAWKIIQIIGEPFLKYKLEEKFHENYSSDKVKNEAKIKRLEEEIERLKSVKSKD